MVPNPVFYLSYLHEILSYIQPKPNQFINIQRPTNIYELLSQINNNNNNNINNNVINNNILQQIDNKLKLFQQTIHTNINKSIQQHFNNINVNIMQILKNHQ